MSALRTTGRFKSGGDRVPHLVESPTFDHNDAHVVLQIADIVASSLLFPMACTAYCSCLIHNLHLNGEYANLRERYAPKLKTLESNYTDEDGKRCNGIRVTDKMNNQPPRALFKNIPFDVQALTRFRRGAAPVVSVPRAAMNTP